MFYTQSKLIYQVIVYTDQEGKKIWKLRGCENFHLRNFFLLLNEKKTPYAQFIPCGAGEFSWLALSSLIVYIATFSLGLGPVPWILMSELIPTRARGKCGGIVTSFNLLCAFIVTSEFYDLQVCDVEIVANPHVYLMSCMFLTSWWKGHWIFKDKILSVLARFR